MVELDDDVKNDIGGGSNNRKSALEELSEMHGDSEGDGIGRAGMLILGAVAVIIIDMYIGIPIPDGTLLVVAALAFLVLGLWAGMHKHEELSRVADAINDWRQE